MNKTFVFIDNANFMHNKIPQDFAAVRETLKPMKCELKAYHAVTTRLISDDIDPFDVELHCPPETVGQVLGDKRGHCGRVWQPYKVHVPVNAMAHAPLDLRHAFQASVHPEHVGELVLVVRMRLGHSDSDMESIRLDIETVNGRGYLRVVNEQVASCHLGNLLLDCRSVHPENEIGYLPDPSVIGKGFHLIPELIIFSSCRRQEEPVQRLMRHEPREILENIVKNHNNPAIC